MALSIERKNKLEEQEFTQEFLKKNVPVIITDAMNNWEILRKLSSENLVKNFGSREVQVYDDLFNLIDVTNLKDYINNYFNKNNENYSQFVPYVRWYSTFKNLDFVWSDSFFEEIKYDWETPYFLPKEDYVVPFKSKNVNPAEGLFPARGIFISAKGAKTSYHVDPWCSDAILCQVVGCKKVVLHNPSQNSPEKEKVNSYENTVYEDILHPGEILFIPHSWPHLVDTLADSVSITWNFVHISTIKSFVQYLINSPPKEELEVIKYFISKARSV